MTKLETKTTKAIREARRLELVRLASTPREGLMYVTADFICQEIPDVEMIVTFRAEIDALTERRGAEREFISLMVINGAISYTIFVKLFGNPWVYRVVYDPWESPESKPSLNSYNATIDSLMKEATRQQLKITDEIPIQMVVCLQKELAIRELEMENGGADETEV